MALTKLWTAEALLDLDEDACGELIDGDFIPPMPVKEAHSDAALETALALRAFVKPQNLGKIYIEVGFLVQTDPDTLLGPDVAFVRADRVREPDAHGWFAGPPDLAVEVWSPGDRPGLVSEKVRRYLAAGCPLVWEMHAVRKTVTVHQPDQEAIELAIGDILRGDPILPEFEVNVASLFG